MGSFNVNGFYSHLPIEYGDEIGIVLSNIDKPTFEVFIHAKINNKIISQLLYSTFNNIDEATQYYNKLEKYITDFDLEGIVNEMFFRTSTSGDKG